MFITARRSADELNLELQGEWRATQFQAIEAELQRIDLAGARHVRVVAGTAQLDLSGAWLLREFLERARTAGVESSFDGTVPSALRLVERTYTGEMPARVAANEWLSPEQAVEQIGRRTVSSWLSVLDGLDFFGRVCVALVRSLGALRHLRVASIARHVYDTGITAIPIVSLIGFLISVILAYMGAQQLRKFGADIFVVDLVTVGVLRELGVLLTAIIVAGRSGSAFAAEIGAMQLNEEVSALEAIGIDPIDALVLPRVLGLLVALPLLTIIADLIGLVGGGLLCHTLLHMPLLQYLARAQSAIASTTFWAGMIKAPVFAALIALAGCYCGMRVRGSSRELGRLTTLAVVISIFGVLLADALFAVLFLQIDI
ncbi:MAG: ABC transporter permease [Steroidobacteraceae bacterium]|jgi:phospholipid/cholesterol/gamma-HCH transport system permease protein